MRSQNPKASFFSGLTGKFGRFDLESDLLEVERRSIIFSVKRDLPAPVKLSFEVIPFDEGLITPYQLVEAFLECDQSNFRQHMRELLDAVNKAELARVT